MSETLSLFRSSFNESLRIESRLERLTGDPEAVLLARGAQQIGQGIGDPIGLAC